MSITGWAKGQQEIGRLRQENRKLRKQVRELADRQPNPCSFCGTITWSKLRVCSQHRDLV